MQDTDESEAPTLVRCPACQGHGRRHISGSMKLDEFGIWDAKDCPLCRGIGAVAPTEAAFWRRAHDHQRKPHQ